MKPAWLQLSGGVSKKLDTVSAVSSGINIATDEQLLAVAYPEGDEHRVAFRATGDVAQALYTAVSVHAARRAVARGFVR